MTRSTNEHSGAPHGRRLRLRSLGAGTILALALLAVSGAATAYAATNAVAPPQIVRAPVIHGTAREGQLLRADIGKWRTGTVTRAVYTFQWQRCNAAGVACTDIADATDAIYAVRHGDIGGTLVTVVTATRPDGGTTPAASAATAVVTPARAGAPAVTVRPTIVGTPAVGNVLTAQTGTWTGTEPLRLRVRWRRCPANGGACRDLARVAETYVVRRQDVGQTLRVLVTARNAVSTGSALSDPTVAATLPGVVPPTPTGEPVIGGTPQVGSVLQATRGVWRGTTPLRFTYQWRRCQGAGAPDASDCRVIGGATSARYVAQRADLGARLRVRVTATNGAGSATATSNPTAAVAAAPAQPEPPRAAGAPTVTGTGRMGQTLTATSGSWTGTAPITFAYRWLRCGASGGSPNGSGCTAIPGATGAAYRLTRTDVGTRLRVRVSASNRGGTATAVSGPTATIQAQAAPAAPRNVREPLLTGTPIEGQTLTTSLGDWAGAQPITYAYQWVRCGADGGRADGSNCAVIPGATTLKYVLAAGDIGKRIRSRIIARNAGGQQTAASNATAAVTPLASGPPRDMREPAIAGGTVQGQTLTATSGTWAGAKPITFSYQWVRCGADGGRPDGSNCPAIPGATTTKYTLAAADVGNRLRVRVTGRNASGVQTVASNATARIAGGEPTLPAGAVKLPNGRYSIPVTSVSLPVRLVIDGVSFRPNPVRTRRTTLELRVHVVDTRGFIVRNAMIFGRSTPGLTSPAGEQRTAMDGWAVLRMVPKASFPLRTGYNVQFFVRARKPGGSLLAGVSTRRLVQVRTVG
jgi:hypothetical protein